MAEVREFTLKPQIANAAADYFYPELISAMHQTGATQDTLEKIPIDQLKAITQHTLSLLERLKRPLITGIKFSDTLIIDLSKDQNNDHWRRATSNVCRLEDIDKFAIEAAKSQGKTRESWIPKVKQV